MLMVLDIMSRPQIGIDRLPARRMTSEPREAMNCKSCRKRKIKCNRLRPTCEACQVFAVPCVYDAVPKKRGPKTDVLESLLKRVDGLEKRLKDEKQPGDSSSPKQESPDDLSTHSGNGETGTTPTPVSLPTPTLELSLNTSAAVNGISIKRSPTDSTSQTQRLYPDILLDIYFARIHGKPFYIIDEASIRQRIHRNQLPDYLTLAIYALSARYASQFGGYTNAVRAGNEYARRSRQNLDIDEPCIETMQALLLLSQASFQAGRGKKSYMYLSAAISMAFALDLHRELPSTINVTSAEREGRRKLFWACYFLDRFLVCGSSRPSLISDECILLRLPYPHHDQAIEGDYFTGASNLQYMGSGKQNQGSSWMLIDIIRILGITNRYLAAGGVKGDSHFPWHSLSNLSKIRQELDGWAAETQDTFSSLDSLFGRPESTVLVLSKLVYHLIHCLIYRPFLPVDLAELSGTSQHQPWQIEATNMCFLHANAISELAEIWKTSSVLEWPAFVGYCVCTAGTIHVHGVHYQGRDGEVFSSSTEFFSREVQQLSELRYIWNGVQHQQDTLQRIYVAHSELVKSLSSSTARFSPHFNYEDFFERYQGSFFDGAFLTFSDVNFAPGNENMTPYPMNSSPSSYRSPTTPSVYQSQYFPIPQTNGTPNTPFYQLPRKRRATLVNLPPSPSDISPKRIRDRSATVDSSIPNASQSLPTLLSSDGKQGVPIDYPFSPSVAYPSAIVTNPDTNTYDPMFSVPAALEGESPRPPVQQPVLSVKQQVPMRHDPNIGIDMNSSANMLASAVPDLEAAEHDPFLSLLEQLAENEQSRGGPSELDFFLGSNG